MKPNNLTFISVVMNTLVPGHNGDVPGRDKGTAARILIVMCTLPRLLHVTSRGRTGRDGGSWACSRCSPCGSAASGTPGDPWPRQPSRSCSSQQPAGPLRLSPMFPLLQTFHWTDGTLVLFNLWGILAFPVFVPLSSYLLSTSLRASVLLASACLFLGSTVRCRSLTHVTQRL